MSNGKATSRQNHATNTFVLRKSFIECDELTIERLRKRSQVRIVGHPGLLQCDRLLDQWYRVRPNKKSAEPRGQGFWQNESLDSDDTSQLRLHRLATKPRRLRLPHRFEHVLKFPYAHCPARVRLCEVTRELRGTAS